MGDVRREWPRPRCRDIASVRRGRSNQNKLAAYGMARRGVSSTREGSGGKYAAEPLEPQVF